MADRVDFRGIAEQVAAEDPIAHSREGYEDGCFFCGADERTIPNPDKAPYGKVQVATHERDCTWVMARLLLGMDLGLHDVKESDA